MDNRNKTCDKWPLKKKEQNLGFKTDYRFLGRYILGYKFGNHVLKLNFRLYIRQYTCPNENFEYSYPINLFLKYIS